MSTGQKKDGRHYCAWRDPDQGGKIVYEYFGFGAEAKKKAAIRDLEVKLAKKTEVRASPLGDAPTFQELAQSCINVRHLELAESTRGDILRTIALYATPVIGDKMINRIGMEDWTRIEKIMLDRKLAAKSINKYFQYLSQVFTFGLERFPVYLPDHPWRHRRTLRTKGAFHIELITFAEFNAILAAADPHLRWALEVEFHTGCRPGKTELFALKWDDFNYETGAVRIYSSKTHSSHVQYVAADFLYRLKEQRAKVMANAARLAKRYKEPVVECPYVISFRGEPIKQLATSWRVAKQTAGITRRIRLYDIRHFYITHALAKGADIQELANRVGHKNANMIVTVYAHLAKELKSQTPFALPDINF